MQGSFEVKELKEKINQIKGLKHKITNNEPHNEPAAKKKVRMNRIVLI